MSTAHNTHTTHTAHTFDFNLDHPVSRKNSSYPGAIGAWIAEMDFPVAAPIREAVARNVEASLFGYVDIPTQTSVLLATQRWLSRSFDWNVSLNSIFCVGDIIAGYEAVIRNLVPANAPIIVPTPAYHLLPKTPRYFGRTVIELPCIVDKTGRYTLDYATLDQVLVPGALFVLTNPYNPVGQVFARDELRQLAALIDAHSALVFADEVHSPLVLNPNARHIPYASLNEAALSHTVTAYSASKAWNIPGLKAAQLVIEGPQLKKIWKRSAAFYADGASRLGLIASIAAYTDPACTQWLDDTRAVIRGNLALVKQHFALHHPAIRVANNDATYLLWIDLRSLGITGRVADYLLEQAHVAVNDGCDYGAPGFIRLNIALEPQVLLQALTQISCALTRREHPQGQPCSAHTQLLAALSQA